MLLTFAMVAALFIVTIMTHYEGMRAISAAIGHQGGNPRRKLLIAVFGVLALHLIEIVTYAGVYVAFWDRADVGSFAGASPVNDWSDLFCFSAEAYTSLGLGDVYPTGWLRLVAGLETLNGLLLLGWSTSFTYLVMERFWRLD